MKIEGKQIMKVQYRELEKLVLETYGFREYSVCAEEELGNGSNMTVDVDGDIDEFDEEDLQQMIVTKEAKKYSTHILMNDLYRKGLIPKGEYLVQIYW